MSFPKIKIPAKLNSRKLWFVLGYAIFVVLNDQLGWNISDGVTVKLRDMIALWVGVEGARDVVVAFNDSKYRNK